MACAIYNHTIIKVGYRQIFRSLVLYISITIVTSYTGKYHKLVAVCIVTSAAKNMKSSTS